jgi:hypothetical protein
MRKALLSVKLLFIGLVASLLVACNPIAVMEYSPSEPGRARKSSSMAAVR